jgi:hypothetical protein
MGFWHKLLGRRESLADVQDSIRAALATGDDQVATQLVTRVLASLLQALPAEKLSALRSLDSAIGRQFLTSRFLAAFRRGWRMGGNHPLEMALREVTAEIEFLLGRTPNEILTALADRINDYFCNAARVFAANNDQSARTAALAAAKVAANEQRESMVMYLRAIAADYRSAVGSSGDLPDRIEALAAEISRKDWQLEDIMIQKRLLGEQDPQYLEALDGSDPTIFVHRFPHLFERPQTGDA